MPMPKSSTPALLLSTVRCFTPSSRVARIRFSGMPHRPKPPIMIEAPSRTPALASASAASRTTLFMCGLPLHPVEGDFVLEGHPAAGGVAHQDLVLRHRLDPHLERERGALLGAAEQPLLGLGELA